MSVKVTVDDRVLVELIRAMEAQQKTLYIVADGVEYGLFQELGTRFMAGKHFMRGAVRAVRDWFVRKWDFHSLQLPDRVVRAAAFMVEARAKKDAPWETGALRASIHVVKGSEYEYEVGSGVAGQTPA